jgi:hypothetical protein
MTPRRTAEERIAERSAKARPEPNDYRVGASAIWIASAGISGFRGRAVSRSARSRTQPRCLVPGFSLNRSGSVVHRLQTNSQGVRPLRVFSRGAKL